MPKGQGGPIVLLVTGRDLFADFFAVLGDDPHFSRLAPIQEPSVPGFNLQDNAPGDAAFFLSRTLGVLGVRLFDQFAKGHVSGIVLVGRTLAKNNVPGSGAVNDLVLPNGGVRVIAAAQQLPRTILVIVVAAGQFPMLFSVRLEPQSIDQSRVISGFYGARVGEWKQLFRYAIARQCVTKLRGFS